MEALLLLMHKTPTRLRLLLVLLTIHLKGRRPNA
jgi:hypothetical protein